MKKILLIIGGFISIGGGVVGVVLPILPAFPFLVLASICFMNSSEKLSNWFGETKLYQKHVKPFQETKGLTLKAKLIILIPVYIMLGSLVIYKDILAMRIAIIVLLIVKTIVFIKMPTLKPQEKMEAVND